MVTLKEVKQILLETECARFQREGLYRSEPVFRQIDGKIADTFFTYGRNREATRFVAPLAVFGIFIETRETAFVQEIESPKRRTSSEPGPQANPSETTALYSEIESLYPMVRECVFAVCDEAHKRAVKRYCAALEIVSGFPLWDVYKTCAPGFFQWVENL